MAESAGMLLRIDYRSGKPVYLQVVDQIKTAAASGTLHPGEVLPSIGALSGELRINRNAVIKAYSELEGLGLIEMQPDGEYSLKGSRLKRRRDIQRTPLTPQIDQSVGRGPQVLTKALRYAILVVPLVGICGAAVVVGAESLLPLIAVIAFIVLEKRAEKVARRIVFAKRFELPRVLRILKAEAASQPDLESFIARVAERTEAVLGARVELIQDRGAVISLVHSFPALREAQAPVSAGADFLMPVFSDDAVHGILRLAPKADGAQYEASELKFLTALGEQVAITANQFRIRHERQESEYAFEIQRGLLPREIPQVAGFTIAGAWQPARAVGGDYYDVFPLGEGHLALVVADVSGKGVPAALLMSNLQATVKAYATVDPSPRALCVKVNRAICGSITPGKFITFFYAVLDAREQRLTYTNAGHNPPLLVRQDGACIQLDPNGPLLGIFPDACYEQAEVKLLAGDRLVLFTDGITEASDANAEEFGEERLIAQLRESSAATAADLCNEIMQRVTQFCREDFADDATVLAVVVESR